MTTLNDRDVADLDALVRRNTVLMLTAAAMWSTELIALARFLTGAADARWISGGPQVGLMLCAGLLAAVLACATAVGHPSTATSPDRFRATQAEMAGLGVVTVCFAAAGAGAFWPTSPPIKVFACVGFLFVGVIYAREFARRAVESLRGIGTRKDGGHPETGPTRGASGGFGIAEVVRDLGICVAAPVGIETVLAATGILREPGWCLALSALSDAALAGGVLAFGGLLCVVHLRTEDEGWAVLRWCLKVLAAATITVCGVSGVQLIVEHPGSVVAKVAISALAVSWVLPPAAICACWMRRRGKHRTNHRGIAVHCLAAQYAQRSRARHNTLVAAG
ncbi:MAG: hypothetical protein ACR2LX_04630 [Jatrophihabitans sp.]